MEDLTIDQLSLLKDIYYDKKLFFGRDKLYKYLRDNHEDARITLRLESFASYIHASYAWSGE